MAQHLYDYLPLELGKFFRAWLEGAAMYANARTSGGGTSAQGTRRVYEARRVSTGKTKHDFKSARVDAWTIEGYEEREVGEWENECKFMCEFLAAPVELGSGQAELNAEYHVTPTQFPFGVAQLYKSTKAASLHREQ
jgi:hypothetical protein